MSEEALIDAVRPHTLLYDPSHRNYMNSGVIDQTWNRIAQELNLKDGSIAKDAWSKLRQRHGHALRRKKKSIPSSIVKKTWEFEKQMDFLTPYMSREFQSRVSFDCDVCEKKEKDFNIDNEHNQYENVSHIISEDNDNNQGSENDDNDPEKDVKIDSIAQNVSEMRKMMDDEMYNRDKSLLYHFFMSMFETAKRMPETHQDRVKKQVFKIISRVEGHLLGVTEEQIGI